MRKLLFFVLLMPLVFSGKVLWAEAPFVTNKCEECVEIVEESSVNIPSIPDDKDESSQGVI